MAVGRTKEIEQAAAAGWWCGKGLEGCRDFEGFNNRVGLVVCGHGDGLI